MAGVGNRVMSTPISAMIAAAATGPIPGISSRRARRRQRGQMVLDLCIEGDDVGVDGVDAVQHPVEQEGVMVVEAAGERLLEHRQFLRTAARAISARTFGSRSPAIIAAIIARPDTPKMSEATTDSLMQASSSSFSTRFFSRCAR